MRKKSSKKKRSSSFPINVYNRIARESLLSKYVESLRILIHFERDEGYGAEESEEQWRNKVEDLRPQVLGEIAIKFAISGKCLTKDSIKEAEDFLKVLEKHLRKK